MANGIKKLRKKHRENLGAFAAPPDELGSKTKEKRKTSTTYKEPAGAESQFRKYIRDQEAKNKAEARKTKAEREAEIARQGYEKRPRKKRPKR